MKRVCLDPGHGIETAGKRSPDGTYREHEFALDMAYRIKALLERHGVEVTLTRWDEHDVKLSKRVKIANGIQGLDLFVSLHSNAAGSGAKWMNARGLSVYVYASDSRSTTAGKAVMGRQEAAGVRVRNDGRPNDGSGLYVVRKTNAPAILVEHLFHDNLEDVALLKDDAYRQRMAEADAKGILDYLGIAWADEKKEESAMTKEEIEALVDERVQAAIQEKRKRNTFNSLADVPECYRGVLSKLMDEGALQGYDGGADGLMATIGDNTIRVDETFCRVLTVLSRPEARRALLREGAAKTYNTVAECPQWAQEAVQWAVDSGYIQGDGTGRLGLDAFKLWTLRVEYNQHIANKGA